MSRSVRHRLARRGDRLRWYSVPIVSPYVERLRAAAFGEDVCRPYVVLVRP